MPLYEYRCVACGHTGTAFRPVAERDSRTQCSRCGSAGMRVLTPPGLIGATVAKTYPT